MDEQNLTSQPQKVQAKQTANSAGILGSMFDTAINLVEKSRQRGERRQEIKRVEQREDSAIQRATTEQLASGFDPRVNQGATPIQPQSIEPVEPYQSNIAPTLVSGASADQAADLAAQTANQSASVAMRGQDLDFKSSMRRLDIEQENNSWSSLVPMMQSYQTGIDFEMQSAQNDKQFYSAQRKDIVKSLAELNSTSAETVQKTLDDFTTSLDEKAKEIKQKHTNYDAKGQVEFGKGGGNNRDKRNSNSQRNSTNNSNTQSSTNSTSNGVNGSINTETHERTPLGFNDKDVQEIESIVGSGSESSTLADVVESVASVFKWQFNINGSFGMSWGDLTQDEKETLVNYTQKLIRETDSKLGTVSTRFTAQYKKNMWAEYFDSKTKESQAADYYNELKDERRNFSNDVYNRMNKHTPRRSFRRF